MKSFLKYTLATIVGVFISFLLISFFLLGTLGIMSSMMTSEKPVEIRDNSVLYFRLSANVPERTPAFPFFGMDPFNLNLQTVTGLNDILANIRKAKEDDRIKGIYLEAGTGYPGIGTVEEIRNALLDFKTSGKFVLFYCPGILLQSAYYLGTAADTLYLNPAGTMQFTGLRSEIMFYKKALEKLGVRVQVVKHGKFKSAVEPFIRDHMSKENREQIRVYMSSIWGYLLDSIGTARDLTPEELNRLADSLLIDSPQAAVKYGLVDGIRYRDEVLDELKQLSGTSGKLHLISMSKYTKVQPKKKSLPEDKIAIVYAFGDIVMGDGADNNIGAKRFANAIRKAREDSSVKAIVLRVNSPGGSALASDIIWREVSLAEQTKPVVASMGTYAASGGYYILSPADSVFTLPVTLTGSIGVFGLIPDLQKLMNDKLGITFDVEKTNRYADFGSLYRPLSPGEKAFLTTQIENTYKMFVDHVSEGRDLRPSYVDSIGQGRVWSGLNALQNGLADARGGLYDAVDAAAGMAGLETYRTVDYPKQKEPFQEMMKQLAGEVRLMTLPKELRQVWSTWQELTALKKKYTIQARMPFIPEIY